MLKPSDQPFHSPASFNVLSIAGIHFAHISCCYVGLALASFTVVKNNLLLREYACMKFEYIMKYKGAFNLSYS